MKRSYVNIVMLSSQYKNDHRKGLHNEIDTTFSKWSEIVFVEYPYSIFIHTLIKFSERFLYFIKHGNYFSINKTKVYTPVVLFHDKIYRKFAFTLKIDSYLISWQIKKLLRKKFKGYKSILWVYNPLNCHVVELTKANLTIYDFYDNFSYDFNGKFNEKSNKLNNTLIRKSDLVFCTAITMYNQSILLNRNSYYIPNGHNNPEVQKKGVNLNISGDIIGYLGNIRNWIDFDLIKKIVEALGKDQFMVFVGPVEKNVALKLEALKRNKKFIHIESVERDEVFSYIKSFDAGIIPFKINKFTEGVLPYKFFEYISCGIKIISTPLPDLKQFNEVIEVAKSDDDFIDKCINVRNLKPVNFEMYKKISYESRWSNRAHQMEKIIKELII